MNNFQRITASRETLAAFLGTIPAIETPWDDAFHRLYCSSCSAADCDDCRRPERDSPLLWLGLPAAEADESALLALIENIQRRDLHYLEEAAAIAAYLRRSGATQEEAAARLGRSPSALANKLRLLRLSPECCRLLVENGLTERHARALLRLEDEEERLDALRHMIRGHLNVAQTEQYIEKRLARLQATPPAGRRIFLLKDVRLFLNSLDRGLRLIREAGVGAESRREDTEDAILLTIRIPKAAGHPPAPLFFRIFPSARLYCYRIVTAFFQKEWYDSVKWEIVTNIDRGK